MKKRVSDKYPVMFSIMLGILLTLFIAVASVVAEVLKFNGIGLVVAQGVAFLLMAIILTVYMKNRYESLSQFGFQKFEISQSKKVLYYMPLLVITLIHPIIGGLNTELTVIEVFIILVFAFLVGYTEESIFRGIIKEKVQFKGKAFYIIFSSTFFGILHMANALSGKNLTSVILQVVNAFLVGLILALLIVIVNNIIPLMSFHFLYDTLAIITNDTIVEKETLVLTILTILYILYGIYLLFTLKHQQKLDKSYYKSEGI